MVDDRPDRLWRVTYWRGRGGYPVPTIHERAQRTFARAADAARFIDGFAHSPRHLRLIAVWTTATDWEATDPARLPRHREDANADHH